MKTYLQKIYKALVAGALSLVVFFFAVVPAHAAVSPEVAVGIAQLIVSLAQSAEKQSNPNSSQQKAELDKIWTTTLNANRCIEVSADDLWSAQYNLNGSGFPCNIVTKTLGGRTVYVIQGCNWITLDYWNGSSMVHATAFEYSIDGKYVHNTSGYLLYTTNSPTSRSVQSISDRVVANFSQLFNYVDGIEGYLSGISSKLADISNKLDQLIGLSTAASALPSSYYDAIDVLGDITANYESSDDAILQRYFMNPDDPYPISPDFFNNLDRYAVYVTYDDLCKAVTKLNSIGYPSTVQYNSDLGVYYIWSNGYLMNMATHYGISGQQGIRKGYFVLAGYRFLASREKSVPSLLENISATLESVDQHLSGFSSVADIAVCTKSGASVVERKLVSTPFGFNLFYQSIQPCIGRTIKVYDGEAPVEGVLHKLYPLLVNNQYFLCASVMVGERYISDCYVLYPGFSSFACPTNPDLMDKLDELVNVLSSVTPVVTSINNNATSISSSLSRIETALSNLVCHHDYRSMLVLDGESVTFESAVGGEAIDDLTLKIEPEQDYNGYNRPWAGGAGKNLLDDTQRVFAGGNIFFGGATSATSGSSITLPAGTYTFSVITASGAVSNLYLKDKASNAYIAGFPSYDHRSQSFTLEETTELLAFVYCFNYTSVDDIVSAQIESGTAVTPYEPYENLAPLSGRTGMTVTHNGNATTIDWAETAGTVYGGTFDLASGVLTSSMSMISSYAGETLPARWYSDRDVYVAGTTPTLGAQVVYVTNEPITYQLDPVPIYAALGSNVITSDCGSMTLKILDGSNLTDMGYTLIVCQNCGQVQPMFDYSRLLDKLDDLKSTLSSIRIYVNDILYTPTDIDNFTIEVTNDFNTIWYVGEDDGGDKLNLVDVAKDSGLKLGKLFKFIWNVALKDIFNTGGGIDDLSDFYLIEGEGSENLWDS